MMNPDLDVGFSLGGVGVDVTGCWRVAPDIVRVRVRRSRWLPFLRPRTEVYEIRRVRVDEQYKFAWTKTGVAIRYFTNPAWDSIQAAFAGPVDQGERS